RAQAAREAGHQAEADTAEILAGMQAGEVADLRVADAARREWAEAHAGEAEAAQAAECELRRRDQAEHIASTGNAGTTEAQRWPTPETEAEAHLDELATTSEARTEAAEAGREQAQPEPDAEAESAGPERARFLEEMAEISDTIDAIGMKVEQMPGREAE